MNASTLIKNANKCHALYCSATTKAAAAQNECERILKEALPCVSSVAQAIIIIKLSNDKDTFTLAWKKAVVLLGTSGKSLSDLLLIKNCKFRPGSKEEDVQRDLKQKEGLIVRKATDEELLFELYTSGNPWSGGYRQELEAQFGRLAERCNDLNELHSLHNRYDRLHCHVDGVRDQHVIRIEKKCENEDELYTLYDQFRPWLSDSPNKIFDQHMKRVRKAKEENT